jgi:hypothetical protein
VSHHSNIAKGEQGTLPTATKIEASISAQERRRAARYVSRQAKDDADRADLLAKLGLSAEEGR